MTAALIIAAGAGLTLLWAIVQHLLAEEVSAWVRPFARFLIRRASARLPGSVRERYEREWLAELAALADRPISGVLFALGVRRSARATGHEVDSGSEPQDLAGLAGPVLDPAAAKRIVDRLVRESDPGPSAWDAAASDMLEEDFSVDPQLEQLEANWSAHVRRYRSQRPAAGWVERWKRSGDSR